MLVSKNESVIGLHDPTSTIYMKVGGSVYEGVRDTYFSTMLENKIYYMMVLAVNYIGSGNIKM